MLNNIVLLSTMLSVFLIKFESLSIVLILAIFSITALTFAFRFQKMRFAGVLLLANYVYWFASGTLLGAISINVDGAVWLKSFFNGEGRIFLYYLPFIYFTVTTSRQRNVLFLRRFLSFLTLLSLILWLAWFFRLIGSSLLSAGPDFVGLFTSHTGAGSFWGVAFIFFYALYRGDRRIWDGLMSLSSLILMLATGSRQALLAMLGAVFLVNAGSIFRSFRVNLLNKGGTNLLLFALILFGLAIGSTMKGNIRIFERITVLASQNTISEFVDYLTEPCQAMSSPAERKLPRELAASLNEAVANVINRAIFWNSAWCLFTSSPFLGIGFGRYNDRGLQFYGTPGLLYLAIDSNEVIYSDATSHNSYLQFLAEGGLVGLVLILWFWVHLLTYFKGEFKRTKYFLFKAAEAIIVFVLISAFTGHALAAPSLGFMAMSIIGLAYSQLRIEAGGSNKWRE